jgi:hypothetical protein
MANRASKSVRHIHNCKFGADAFRKKPKSLRFPSRKILGMPLRARSAAALPWAGKPPLLAWRKATHRERAYRRKPRLKAIHNLILWACYKSVSMSAGKSLRTRK